MACVLVATVFRQTGVPKWRTIWAEDGTVFAQCAYDRPSLDCLLEPYAGYSHAVPRLASEVAILGDPSGLPSRLMLLAGLVAAFAAVVVAHSVYRLTSSLLAGGLVGVSLALVFPAGVEVLANLANLHWILLAASLIVMACLWLGQQPGIGGYVLFIATILSSPFAPILLVPMAIVAALKGNRGSRPTLLVISVAAAAQLAFVVSSERPAAGGMTPSVVEVARWAWVAVRDWGWFGGDHRFANVLVLTAAVLMPLLLVLQGRRWVAATLIAIALAGVAVFTASAFLVHATTFRYVYVLAIVLLAVLVVGLYLATDQLAPRVRDGLRYGTVAVLGMLFALTFRVASGSSSGPDVLAQIDATTCPPGATVSTLAISPEPWSMTIPCPR